MSDHMPTMTCKRCGICCLADATTYITKDDWTRWKNEGREDILHLLEHEHTLWAGDHLISSEDGRYLHGCMCSFLRRQSIHLPHL